MLVGVDVADDPRALTYPNPVANLRLKNLHRQYDLSIAESAARSGSMCGMSSDFEHWRACTVMEGQTQCRPEGGKGFKSGKDGKASGRYGLPNHSSIGATYQC